MITKKISELDGRFPHKLGDFLIEYKIARLLGKRVINSKTVIRRTPF